MEWDIRRDARNATPGDVIYTSPPYKKEISWSGKMRTGTLLNIRRNIIAVFYVCKPLFNQEITSDPRP